MFPTTRTPATVISAMIPIKGGFYCHVLASNCSDKFADLVSTRSMLCLKATISMNKPPRSLGKNLEMLSMIFWSEKAVAARAEKIP
jgi:hypothetical protein